jgi:hypothetical protein
MDDPKVGFRIPGWAAVLYTFCSIVVLPWTVYLDQNLPARHLFGHWDIAWVGLDIGLLISLLITGILAFRKSLRVVLAAMATGSLLLVDAWFDVMGAHPGKELVKALLAAFLLELPLMSLSFYLAFHVLQKAYER